MKHYRLIDQNPIKTKRLLLTPMNEAELSERISGLQDDLVRNAYVEMRRYVVANHDQALWYTDWRITLRESKKTVGYLGFHGEPEEQTVELGIDIPEEFRDEGYAFEAVKALSKWAFLKDSVYFVRVMTGEESESSGSILQELKFYQIESPLEGHAYWERERNASAWTVVYLSFGLCIGLALGSSFFGSQALGLAVGMGAGLALGAMLDSKDRAARKRENEPKKIGPLKIKRHRT